ncbi:SRPBCC family protein [Undibacterium arcticum]|uniref:SRPBCC family protein n=1 Tax=Undibacterium arcticum TaxID=1762892 RepID=A0ABV7F2J8_9BURK
MSATFESSTLSVRIERDWHEVFDFVSVPENFPKWASGLGAAIRRSGDAWIAATEHGPVRVRFSARNDFGVLDHYVLPDNGDEIYIPMRVIANGAGSEIVFTLFRLPGVSDRQFAEDRAWVQRDLAALKQLLEARATPR